ncbi:hypothetical protein TYRP_014055, partial [Tyrophagus putrescentiae]
MAPHPRSSTPMLYAKQLGALLWKSLIIRKVHFISTFFELVSPLLLIFVFAYLYNMNYSAPSKSHNSDSFSTAAPNDGNNGSDPNNNQVIYDNPYARILFDPKQDFDEIYPRAPFIFLYAPNNTVTQKLVRAFSKTDNGSHYADVKAFNTEAELDEALRKETLKLPHYTYNPYEYVMAVYFQNSEEENVLKNGRLRYKIRMPGDEFVLSTLTSKFPLKIDQSPTGTRSLSLYRSFSTVQAYINRELVKETCAANPSSSISCSAIFENDKKTINVNRMPYPKHKKPNQNLFNLLDIVAMCIPISYVLVCPLIVKRITDEKATKAKELLRLIGMSDFVFYYAHFLNYMALLLVHAILATIIVFAFPAALYSASSPLVFFLGYLIWGAQLILFSHFVTTIFNRPVIATIVMTILWVVSVTLIFRSLVPSVNPNMAIEDGNTSRLMTCLLPSGSLIWFLSIMGALENTGNGLHFTNLNQHTTVYLGFTALQVWLMTLASYVLYFIAIWYLDNVWPFQPGVPKSPFYLFYPSYWCPKETVDEDGASAQSPNTDARIFESEPNDLNASIRIENVSKVFNSATMGKKVAVNELWLNIYQNQLTVLLGHNGAYGASSGSIFVNGYNVFTQTKKARRSIGLCPQENIIFNELTVAQHLRLFATLKDYPRNLIEGEIDNILQQLHLQDKKNVLATKLSGGMKRKLALGIALIGETETLILDEPTSGMDPDARRAIWDILLSIRRNRTILLTTHYMEEADVLGDRIAIMNEGRLCCSGAPFFLKNAFGTGYRLRVAKHSNFNSIEFEKVLRRYISSAALSTEIETEVVYTLDDANMDKKTLLALLPTLFDDIEKNKAVYGVDSCGLSYTTLEDVFLSVGSDINLRQSALEGKDAGTYGTAENGNAAAAAGPIQLCGQEEMNFGVHLVLHQFLGLLLKRFHFARRYWPMMILQIIIPLLIIVLAMFTEKAISTINQVSTASITLNVKDIYGPGTETFFYGGEQLSAAYKAVNEDAYSAGFTSLGGPNSHDKNVSQRILDQASGVSLQSYIQHHLYGAGESTSANQSFFESWANSEQTHSLPLSITALFESLLRLVLPESLQKQVSILVQNVPMLVASRQQDLSQVAILLSWALTCLIFLPIAFPFLAASYILYPIKENASKAKLIQLMTKLSPVTFWTASFVFDLLNHLLAITIMIIVIFLFDSNNIVTSNGSGVALFVLLFTFGISTVPVSYFLSYRFQKPSSGFVFLIIVFFLVGFIGNIIFSILDVMFNYFDADLPAVQNFWMPFILFFLRFIPIFSMLFGYQKVHMLAAFGSFCKNMQNGTCDNMKPDDSSPYKGCCSNVCGDKCYLTGNPFAVTKYGAGQEMIYMFCTGIFCFTMIVLAETFKQQFGKYLSFSGLINLFRKRNNDGFVELNSPRLELLSEDSDVDKERVRIEEEVSRDRFALSDLLVVNKLGKKFGNFTAVDQLTFGVHYNECFGLLGVNGAGDLLPSSGNAYVQGGQFGLIENLKEFQLTGEETLYLFARLRGVPQAYIRRDVSNLVKMVGLEAHASKRTDTYSGGNQRKLCLAIALMGNPPLIFLDEPSAGVDPAARRKIWQTLGYLKRHFKSSIVLTSHSMEECEALCARIGIMVNGRFRCLGSTQHLRSKYGQGYSVTISLKKQFEANQEYLNSVQQGVTSLLPSALMKDYHQCLLHYHIPDPNEKWSNIFRQMSALNERFDFEDYVVSDTTLEQIFILFARHQVVGQVLK